MASSEEPILSGQIDMVLNPSSAMFRCLIRS